jgi:hypothetical protein
MIEDWPESEIYELLGWDLPGRSNRIRSFTPDPARKITTAGRARAPILAR